MPDEEPDRGPPGRAGLYRTVYEVEVLSVGPFDAGLATIASYATTLGDCCWQARQVRAERVSRARMRRLLRAHHGDPVPLLGVDGPEDVVEEPAARAAARARVLAALRELGVDGLDRIGDDDQAVLVGVALPVGADRLHLWVDGAAATRREAIAAIHHDGVNPLPALLVCLDDPDGEVERLGYDPLVGLTVGEDTIALGGADHDALIDLLGFLDD